MGSYNGRSIEKAHERKMKEEGMDEHSFDAVADNLLATLAELNVPQDIVDDVVAIVLPFRDLFEVTVPPRAGRKKKTDTPLPFQDAAAKFRAEAAA